MRKHTTHGHELGREIGENARKTAENIMQERGSRRDNDEFEPRTAGHRQLQFAQRPHKY